MEKIIRLSGTSIAAIDFQKAPVLNYAQLKELAKVHRKRTEQEPSAPQPKISIGWVVTSIKFFTQAAGGGVTQLNQTESMELLLTAQEVTREAFTDDLYDWYED